MRPIPCKTRKPTNQGLPLEEKSKKLNPGAKIIFKAQKRVRRKPKLYTCLRSQNILVSCINSWHFMHNQTKSEQIILIPETEESNNAKFNHEVI